MKKIQKFILPILSVFAFASCNDAKIDTPQPLKNESQVSFSAFIGTLATRATETAWEANDAIGVYALNNGTTLTATNVYDGKENIKYVTASAGATGQFEAATASEAVMLPGDGTKVDFVAYYPHTTTVNSYAVAVDVTTQTNPAAIDFLYATATNITKANPDVALPFSHRLARVVVTLQKASGANIDLDNAKVSFKSAITNGTLSLVDGNVTVGTTKKDVVAVMNNTAHSGTAILVPGQKMEEITVVITLADGKKYEWTPATHTLASNTSNSYSLTLTDGSVAATGKGSTVSDWGTGTTGSGTLNPSTTTPAVTVDKATVSLAAAAASETITVTTDVATQTWTVSGAPTWLTVNPTAATGSGTFSVAATANTTPAQRTATLTVTPGTGDAVTIQVTQAAGASTPTVGDGTKANPYTVEQAISNQGENAVWVRAFIVGYISSKGFVLNTTNASGSNIAVAESTGETSEAKILGVQLPKGTARDNLNLSTNPNKLHTEVLLKGNLAAYYSKPGLKSVSEYEVK